MIATDKSEGFFSVDGTKQKADERRNPQTGR